MTKTQKEINWAEEEESSYYSRVKVSPVKKMDSEVGKKMIRRPCTEAKEVNVILPISG